jgi:hypothetical protein
MKKQGNMTSPKACNSITESKDTEMPKNSEVYFKKNDEFKEAD